MISLQNISKQYTGRVLFSGASFDVQSGEKIGLVGRNGHGKTTIFRIITGAEQPDEGRLLMPKNYVIGYLDQHLILTKPTVLEEACQGLRPHESDEEWKVKKILSGLGFSEEDFWRHPSEFSGGYQVRIALAKALVSEPDMLLLDEPTNFLDIVSIRWLEKFLRSWRKELLIISHDRDFMDSVTTHIVGIHRGVIRKIKGDTEKYYDQMYEDEEIYEKRRVNDEKKRKEVMEYVNTFRAKARHAKSVQSSLRRLDKMEKLEKLGGIHTLSFGFNHSPFHAGQIMNVNDLKFSYDGEEPFLINGLSFSVDKDDKICIIGKNGKGKTTLLKLLAGRLTPVAGTVKTHQAALTAYFEQANTAELHDDSTIEEEIGSSRAYMDRTQIRGICGAMMFQGDDALKKIRVLSGGERSRVLLGKQLAKASNLLLLDEPTHHLDMESCQAMADAVRDFPGAAIVVTHDEHFLNEVATKLIVFQNGVVSLYPGPYSEFLERVGWTEDEKRPGGGKGKKEERKARADLVTQKSRTLKPLEENMKVLEIRIVSSEGRLSVVNEEIVRASERGDAAKIVGLSKEMKELVKLIDQSYEELQAATQKYEEEKKKFDNDAS
jgi:ATP-binding cassette subfamily F protein 3